MDVVTTRHPRRATVTATPCSTRPPIGHSGGSRSISPVRLSPPVLEFRRLSYKAWGARNDDAHLSAMCGIAGFWDRGPVRTDQARRRLVAMTDTLRHRGPDDAGEFLEEDVGLALGSRRLAIVDLSTLGHQPMESPDGRYVLAFNREMYH